MDTVAIRLDAVTRRWAFAGFVLFAVGGVALLVVAFGGFAAQTGSQRMYTAIFGALCLAFAALVFGRFAVLQLSLRGWTYGYALGRLGRVRLLYTALSRFAPSRVLELRR